MKNNNVHVIRMVQAIQKIIGEKDALNFEAHHQLSKSATIEKKFKWAKDSCDYLNKKYDDPTLLEIRKQCFCNDGSSSAKRMVGYLTKTQSIKDFVDLFNTKEKYGSLEYINENKLLMCYPECYCSCVKRINEQLPVTWCYCTVGYVTHLFSQVFDHPVEVHLIESVKTGGARCAISVEW